MVILNLRKDDKFWHNGDKLSPRTEFYNGIHNFAQGCLNFDKPSFENINCTTRRTLSHDTITRFQKVFHLAAILEITIVTSMAINTHLNLHFTLLNVSSNGNTHLDLQTPLNLPFARFFVVNPSLIVLQLLRGEL